MPQEGNQWLSRKELMTYEEMLRLCSLLVKMGIEKIRITGGEPFIRKDIISFLASLSRMPGLKEIAVTTNGVATAPLIPELVKLGICSVNLSIDSLDRNRFFSITRRDELPAVLKTLEQLISHGFNVKINAVVMEDKNIEDIFPLIELTKREPVTVRFIEEMPFNGEGKKFSGMEWHHLKIIDYIKETYPGIQKITDPPFSTSSNYHIPGYKGSIGIIAAYSRSFCGTCNRLRVTAQGLLKTCLYDKGVLNMKDLMRTNITDPDLVMAVQHALYQKEKNGWEAERKRSLSFAVHDSMASIGG